MTKNLIYSKSCFIFALQPVIPLISCEGLKTTSSSSEVGLGKYGKVNNLLSKKLLSPIVAKRKDIAIQAGSRLWVDREVPALG